MSNRTERIKIAKETLEILEEGFYRNSKEKIVQINDSLKFAMKNTIHYTPDMLKSVNSQRDKIFNKGKLAYKTIYEIRNETSLKAAKRLTHEEEFYNVLCLNFASAKNPGGGFLRGSDAQEESLARSSGLYPCIAQMKGYYESNKKLRSSLYTDNMIYSPKVPVFRNDDGRLLDAPYLLSIITAPAVNKGAIIRNEPKKATKISSIMENRIEKLLSIAIIHHHDAIILGAWGCGVFKNNPSDVKGYFKKFLVEDTIFRRCFKKVHFAILDKTKNKAIIGPFKNAFPTEEMVS
ncbi:MAG: TIGR02452 family protein [Promethearchaeota archaeon]